MVLTNGSAKPHAYVCSLRHDVIGILEDGFPVHLISGASAGRYPNEKLSPLTPHERETFGLELTTDIIPRYLSGKGYSVVIDFDGNLMTDNPLSREAVEEIKEIYNVDVVAA